MGEEHHLQRIGDADVTRVPDAAEALGTASPRTSASLWLPLGLLFCSGLVLRLWALA